MKKVAWVGNAFFFPHFLRLGFEGAHIRLAEPMALTWQELCSRAGFEPDMVVYADTSLPPPLVGLERWPSLNVFYAIDTHIHAWYPFYAQAFDLAAVSLKGHMWRFEARLTTEELLWLPPAAQDQHQPDWEAEKEWDILFAGSVDQLTTPKRYEFLRELGSLVDGLVVKKGKFAELFPRARLSLNIAERGDLNFRVFEALACGACLVTPEVKHGFSDLFENGCHLFTYDPRDMDGLVRLLQGLLKSPQRCHKVAQAGHALVHQKHRFANRALALRDFVASRPVDALIEKRRAMAEVIRETFLKEILLHNADRYKEVSLGERYLRAALGKAGE
ncbi:MAG: glycosyltransferase [Proteobacteria bacterium]|nr:glycosyltransferase [Pseudomonadota bacterium]MBU1610819.1 glycosyltransferase [Pseudomonadota bacterium]